MADPKPQRWWVSWYQPGEDYRPVKKAWPVPAGILGYWCSGQECGGQERSTLVAWVEGDEKTARKLLAKCWPEFKKAEERFFNECEPGFKPNDRFPLPDWSAAK